MPTSGRNPDRPLIFFGSPSLRRNRKAHQLRQDERGLGSSPKDKAKSLSIAEGYEALAPGAGTIHCHGARGGAEPGHQGRRDAVQRGPALMAALLRGIAKAEPLAAGRAVGIQALNCSACQRVHRSLRRAAATREKYRVNERNSAPAALVSQEKYPLLVGVRIRQAANGESREAEQTGVRFGKSSIVTDWRIILRRSLQQRFQFGQFLLGFVDGLLLFGDFGLLVGELARAGAIVGIIWLA